MRKPTSRQAGLTLIELMIAVTLGLLLAAGIGALFVSTHRSNRQNDLLAGMQDQARFAMATLSRDITMAGYWGGMPNAASIATSGATGPAGLPASADCGATASTSWAYTLTQSRTETTTTGSVTTSKTFTWPNRAEFRNGDTATSVSSVWNCIGHYVTGTDVVALRRVAGQATTFTSTTVTSPTAVPQNFYLKTNGVIGTMVRCADAPCNTGEAPLSPPATFYKYVPRIYFIRDFAHAVGDKIPALCRKELCQTGFTSNSDSELSSCGGTGTSGGLYSECIADGVEDLQIVWGVDTDSDGMIDRYTSTPTAEEVAKQALSAQIFLRIRSAASDPSYTDTKTYTAGDGASYTPSTATDPTGTAEKDKAKHFYRREYSTTVNLRNPAR